MPASLSLSPGCLRPRLSEPPEDEDDHASAWGQRSSDRARQELRPTLALGAEALHSVGPCLTPAPPSTHSAPLGSPVGEKRSEVTRISGLK